MSPDIDVFGCSRTDEALIDKCPGCYPPANEPIALEELLALVARIAQQDLTIAAQTNHERERAARIALLEESNRRYADQICRLEAAAARDERVLRASVPDDCNSAFSPVGTVQNYIAQLESENRRLRVDAERLDWLNDNWCYPVDSQNECEYGDWRVAIDMALVLSCGFPLPSTAGQPPRNTVIGSPDPGIK